MTNDGWGQFHSQEVPRAVRVPETGSRLVGPQGLSGAGEVGVSRGQSLRSGRWDSSGHDSAGRCTVV